MKKSNKRKPLILVGAIALAAVTVLSATFAWFTASDSATNKLATKDGLANVSIQETFVPPDDWKPGQTVTKEVGVANTGTAPALVRVSFDELMGVNTLISPAPATAWDPASTTTAPQLFDTTLYTADPWVKYTAYTAPDPNPNPGGVTIEGIPADVTVYVKYVPAGTNGSSTDSWSFAAWAPIGGTGPLAGSAQAVTYAQAWDQTSKTMTMSNVAYSAYAATTSPDIDWTKVITTPIITPPAAADIGYSQAEAAINALAGPTNGNYNKNIALNYNTADLNNTAPTAGDWYYNPRDGYFYYIGLVQPGTTTPSLLNSLTLNPNADANYYSNLDYTLKVNMQALQDTKAAIDAEWPTVAGNTALQTALYALCES